MCHALGSKGGRQKINKILYGQFWLSSLKPLDTTLEFVKMFNKIGLSNKDIDTIFKEVLLNENFKLKNVFKSELSLVKFHFLSHAKRD
jgi:hypothetical protein